MRFLAIQKCRSFSATRLFAANDPSRRTPSPPPPFDLLRLLAQRGPQLREFVDEAATVLRSNGLNGVRRSIQAAVATGTLVSDTLTTGSVEPPPVLLRKLFERLGATYIKLGQFIASSPTLFPDAYVLEFQKCLDKTDPVPFDVIQKRIEEELGFPPDRAFASIDPVPLASASIAQVHSAVLKSSQKDVVIKVLKPGVEDVLTADLSFLYLASKFLEILNPELARLSLSDIVSDIRRTISEEVDFRKEAQHIAHFQTYLQSAGLVSVAKAPFVYSQFSTEKCVPLLRWFTDGDG